MERIATDAAWHQSITDQDANAVAPARLCVTYLSFLNSDIRLRPSANSGTGSYTASAGRDRSKPPR